MRSCLSIPLCIAYAALCVVLLFCGLLALTIWLFRRRRAGRGARYPRAWDRYIELLQGLNGDSAAPAPMRRLSHQSGLTLDELDLVAPARKFGLPLQEDPADDEQEPPSSAEIEKKSAGGQIGNAVPADRASPEESAICAICLEDMEITQKIRRLPCFHEYHSGCVEKWTSKVNRCPVCSRELLPMEIVRTRRNARSSARRCIDASIIRERRGRELYGSGRYGLSDTRVHSGSPIFDTPEDALENCLEDSSEDTTDQSFHAESSAV